MPHPFLDDVARPLLVLHALLGIAALGSSMHLAVLGALLLTKKRAPARLIRVHARVLAAVYAAVFAVGLAIYPAFRVLVRGLVLDRDAPWASNAFDFKEAVVLAGLPVVAALFLAGRRFELPRDQEAAPLVGALGVVAGLVVVVAVVVGLVVTTVRGPS